VVKSRHARSDAAPRKREDATHASAGEHKDPLEDAHVGAPRWRAPISSTPEPEDEAPGPNAEPGDDDDTLEFERPKHEA
jgi:hypothetical protein